MKTDGILFFFGKIAAAHDVSVQSLACNVDRVLIFTDDSSYKSAASNVMVCLISLTELKSRILRCLGLKCRFSSPYKLCDLKPFWPLLAASIVDLNDSTLCFDVDCLYGDLTPYLQDLRSDFPTAIGRYGHLQGANKAFRQNVYEWANNFFGQSLIRILESPRNFAFDEMLYFNKFLAAYEKLGLIKWEQKISDSAIDISYWSRVPRRFGSSFHVSSARYSPKKLDVELTVRRGGKTKPANVLTCPVVSYLHFQKRKMSTQFLSSASFFESGFEICFSNRGDVYFTRTGCLMCKNSLIRDAQWKVAMLWKRLQSKIRVEALPTVDW